MAQIIFKPVDLTPELEFPGSAAGQGFMDLNMTEFDGLNCRFKLVGPGLAGDILIARLGQ